VIAYSVARRANEIGIRMTLGARPSTIVNGVRRESLLLVAVGLAVGLPAALACARLVSSRLYEVKPGDPWSIGAPNRNIDCDGACRELFARAPRCAAGSSDSFTGGVSASTHVALLRGVNVGGKNCVPMKDLAEIFAKAGCAEVRTYVQSGNVVFRATRKIAESLPPRITEQIAKRLGCQIPITLRTAEQFAAAVRNNPFREVPEEALYVYFLAGIPDAARTAQLDPDRSKPDAFIVHGREIYLHLPNGIGRSKLTNAYFDSKLATTSTARNWRTTLKLLEWMS
jgi:uncharacterized protein (DUF1697 family)